MINPRFLSYLLSVMSVFSVASFHVRGERIDSLSFSMDIEQSVSVGNHTPFWLVSNRQGLSSIEKGSGFVRLKAEKKQNSQERFSWGGAVDVAVPWRFTSSWVIQQLYAEVRYRGLNAMIGSKEMWNEFNDRELSSGGLHLSGNARPIPQIRIGIFDFQPLNFSNRWIWIKGYMAYGAFTDSEWQKRWAEPLSKRTSGALYCSRGLWLKGGNLSKFPVEFTAGIEMGTEFGGERFNYYTPEGDLVDVKLPSGPMAWLKAFVPLPGDKTSINGEQTNVEGNMTGAYDFNLLFKPNDRWSMRAYWQHMFEDHSMLWLDFPWKDGLWGFQMYLPRNPVVSSFVIEYLYSKFQSGSVNHDWTPEIPEQVSGADGYYNHYIYTGWQHWGMGIGNPFFVSPIYNDPHMLMFNATRNISWHFGISGRPVDSICWRVLLSNTRSWGNYIRPYAEVRSMWNFLMEAKWRPYSLRGFESKLSVAFDKGNLIGNSFGVSLGVSYELGYPLHNNRDKK